MSAGQLELLRATEAVRQASATPACGWCRRELAATGGPGRRFCSRKCRQAAFRLRRRRTTEGLLAVASMTFAYADPPYPGLSAKYYRDEPSFAGEVDHAGLVASLLEDGYDGWALSTGAYALRELLPLCPPEVRVCAWVKPIGVSSRTYGVHNAWEPVLVSGGRQLRPGVRDFLRAMPARKEGTLPGRKPIAFCAWLFDVLGMLPGDTLVDLFPGSGIVTRCWGEASSKASRESFLQERDGRVVRRRQWQTELFVAESLSGAPTSTGDGGAP